MGLIGVFSMECECCNGTMERWQETERYAFAEAVAKGWSENDDGEWCCPRCLQEVDTRSLEH